MKKLMALVLALVLALAAVPALGAEDYTGSWYVVVAGITMTQFDFNADGTVTSEAMEAPEGTVITWEATENGVKMTNGEEAVELVYDGTALVNAEAQLSLTREPGKFTMEMITSYFSALTSGETPELPEGIDENELMQAVMAIFGGGFDAAAMTPVFSDQHKAYMEAELDSEVEVETFVQATQSWWDNKITVYAQDVEGGGYFIYNMACSEEDAERLTPGTCIRVKGFKSEWSGEVEITDATFEIVDGFGFEANPVDVTDKLGTDELINYQNMKVSFKGMTVEAYDESGAAFAYKNAENKTDDLYVKLSKDGQTYDFCVEFYLCGQDSDVYKAVEGLQVGDVIDVDAFLYWYNGANPHMISVTKAE